MGGWVGRRVLAEACLPKQAAPAPQGWVQGFRPSPEPSPSGKGPRRPLGRRFDDGQFSHMTLFEMLGMVWSGATPPGEQRVGQVIVAR